MLKSLNFQTFVAIVLGAIFGLYLPNIALEQKVIGDVFVALLKMLIVPLVFASIYVAVASIGDGKTMRSLGLKTVGLYILTTALAVAAAILVMNIVNIGKPINAENLVYAGGEIKHISVHDTIMSFVPSNIFNSLVSGSMMQIILFAGFLSIASFSLKDKHKEILFNFFDSVNEVMFSMANKVIKLTPIGVFSLISYIIAKQGGVDSILNLWAYILVVLVVIIIHGVITLPVLLKIFTKGNPFKYINSIKEAPIVAFSTASSAATLPISLKVAQDSGIDKKNANFVLPLGATVSMDGTAAYLTVAVLYIANLAGSSIGIGEQIALGLTVVALSVGVAALPSASLALMVVILDQAGLPIEYLAIIVVVDRLLDMARTSLNVTSDLVVVKIVDVLEKTKKVTQK